MKMSLLLVTSLGMIGQESGTGCRLIAIAAACAFVLGAILFMKYNEKHV